MKRSTIQTTVGGLIIGVGIWTGVWIANRNDAPEPQQQVVVQTTTPTAQQTDTSTPVEAPEPAMPLALVTTSPVRSAARPVRAAALPLPHVYCAPERVGEVICSPACAPCVGTRAIYDGRTYHSDPSGEFLIEDQIQSSPALLRTEASASAVTRREIIWLFPGCAGWCDARAGDVVKFTMTRNGQVYATANVTLSGPPNGFRVGVVAKDEADLFDSKLMAFMTRTTWRGAGAMPEWAKRIEAGQVQKGDETTDAAGVRVKR